MSGNPGHRIEWFLDRDSVEGHVICEAAEGASCRRYCPAGCEYWPCEHDLADSGDCNAVEWFDATGTPADSYANKDRVPLRDGPIDVWWDGDGWIWEYPPPGALLQSDPAEQLDRIREMLGLQCSDEDVPEALGKYLLHLERLVGNPVDHALADIVHRLAICDPRPTTDQEWCFFCGRSLPRLTTEPLETGHDLDGCLWVAARRASLARTA